MRLINSIIIISFILIIEGFAYLLCIPVAIYYHEPLNPFFIPALIVFVPGLVLYFVSSKKVEPLKSNREGFVLIIFSWLLLILAGTLPYLSGKTMPSLVDTFFETISGVTTTGSSILTNIEQLPRSILFWRSLTQWLGGIATIIMVMTIIPLLNIGGYKLFSLEVKTFPDFRFIVKRIVIIYFVLTVAQVLLLCSGGMNLFKSLCYSFGTVSTGCFSPNNERIAEYSPYIQYIITLFMFLSGASYVVYYHIITGKFKTAKKNEEIRVYSVIIIFIALFITGILYLQSGKRLESAFRESIFQVTSFVTSSGYSITDYSLWPDYILAILFFLLLIGGSTSSPSGGIKMSRFLVVFRNLKLQFKNPNSPSNISEVKYQGRNIDEDTNLSVLTFITVFGMFFVLGTIVLSLFENDLKNSAFLSISALTTFGHNLNLSGIPNAEKIILSFLMLLGKLEIFPLLLVLIPSFYRNTIKTSKKEKLQG